MPKMTVADAADAMFEFFTDTEPYAQTNAVAHAYSELVNPMGLTQEEEKEAFMLAQKRMVEKSLRD
jgi:hypothetical protein